MEEKLTFISIPVSGCMSSSRGGGGGGRGGVF